MTDQMLTMLVLHSLQTEAWADAILTETSTIREFKQTVALVRNSTRQLNTYCAKIMTTDEYDTSAEISDSFYEMALLPADKIDELTKIMKEFIKNNK